MSHLLNQLKSNVLVADGAIGTIFYSEGLDTCPEAYNLTHPDKVERIHRSYIEAGADVIQTNTYGANFEKLKSFGFEHKVKEIHQAAVQIAKRAANEDTIILGTVGGFRGVRQEDISLSTIQYHTELQDGRLQIRWGRSKNSCSPLLLNSPAFPKHPVPAIFLLYAPHSGKQIATPSIEAFPPIIHKFLEVPGGKGPATPESSLVGYGQ